MCQDPRGVLSQCYLKDYGNFMAAKLMGPCEQLFGISDLNCQINCHTELQLQ